VRPISPDTGAPERVIAEEQEEYLPLPVAYYTVDQMPGARMLLTRWTFTPEERLAIAEGADLYIGQINFGTPMAPMEVTLDREKFVVPPTG
jgi:hypothetical protein